MNKTHKMWLLCVSLILSIVMPGSNACFGIMYLSHCLIYRFKLSFMCLLSFTSRHVFVIWYKTIAKMRRKPQHVGNISSHLPYMLRFSSHFWFLYQMTKMWRDVKVWRHIHLCLDLYITQWDKIQDSKTCVWTQHKHQHLINTPSSNPENYKTHSFSWEDRSHPVFSPLY